VGAYIILVPRMIIEKVFLGSRTVTSMSDDVSPVTRHAWRAHGPKSLVCLSCGHDISQRSADTIYDLGLEGATDAGLTEDLPDATCRLFPEPWLLPDSLPLATDVIRVAVECRRQSLTEASS
jgi:hypothetical protein